MNLIAMILAARFLGAEGFGAFSLVQSTLGVFGMFAGAALGETATRFIAATRHNNPERTGRIVGLVILSSLALSLFFGSVVVALAPWLARTVIGSPELSPSIALGAFLVAMGVVRGVQDATLAGFEAFQQIAFLRFVEGGTALALLPVLVRQFGPAGGISALALGLLLAALPGVVLTRNKLIENRVVPHWREAVSEWRLLRDFSAPSLLANTVATPVVWTCTVLLGNTPNGLAELGLYNGAYQWHGPMVFVPMVIASVSLPILAQIWERRDIVGFRKLFLKFFLLGTLLAILPALIAAILSSQIMEMYGKEFRSGETVLILLLLAAPLHVASNIATSAIQSMNRSWFLPLFHGIWGSSLLLLTVLTINTRGAEGFALAFFVSYFILALSKAATVIWFTFAHIKSQL